jgi:MFS transporter, OFA family, oxalate/formate antiporter
LAVPAFIVLSGLVFFGWGESFSLFPSTLTDTFGSRYATTNYGFLYIAQGVGSILGGPVAASLRVATGSWTPVFGVAWRWISSPPCLRSSF